MTAELIGYEAVSKSFFTALLLTRDLAWAETIVTQSIESSDFDLLDERMLHETIHASVLLHTESLERTPEALERASACLPPELQRVLHLTASLRHCFVLHILLRLPIEICAKLVHLSQCQFEERTCRAVWTLANQQEIKL